MRLTYSNADGVVWFKSQSKNDIWLEPCEMTAHDNRIAIAKLAAYEDAEEQGRLVILPCKVGDKVRDKIFDHIFTVQTVELGHKAGTLFRCGNPGTDDYVAFYDFEIGEKIEVLPREEAEAEAAIAGMKREIERMVVAGKPRWIPVTERLPEFFAGHGEEERSFCADCAWHGPERQRCSRESEAENCVLWEPNAEPPKEET